jgi:hypothetical protein
MLSAFNLNSGAGLTVEVADDDLADIDEKMQLLEPAKKGGRRRIAITDAFAIALRKLKPLDLLPDLLGQLTGARSIGFSSFHPNLFHVSFSHQLVARPLIPDEEDEMAFSEKCSVSPLSSSASSSSSSPKVDLELPFTVSWYFCLILFMLSHLFISTRTINIPLYKTLKELCLALEVVAKASDEFPLT